MGVDEKTLTLGFANAGARDSFDSGGSAEIVRQAAIDVVGTDWRIETIVDPGASADGPPPPPAEPAEPAAPAAPVAAPETPAAPESPPAWASDEPAAPEPAPEPDVPAEPEPDASAAARKAIRQTKQADDDASPSTALADADADAHPDDADAESDGLAGAELLARELGAEMIEEIPHS